MHRYIYTGINYVCARIFMNTQVNLLYTCAQSRCLDRVNLNVVITVPIRILSADQLGSNAKAFANSCAAYKLQADLNWGLIQRRRVLFSLIWFSLIELSCELISN